MLYPLTFEPIFKERIWGGRNLERLYGKSLPSGLKIGESWEITDRPEGVSVVTNGSFKGKTMRWLMENHRQALLGPQSSHSVFPLLVKILDAEETLSLQVHPPAAQAKLMGGEPKTEMWYIAEARSKAMLYVGLRTGTTRGEFERRLKTGEVEECLHPIGVKTGDSMFIPSGRIHGIGGGNVIFEIQQNSDTTYRVFDWNRVGQDGKRRELHVSESLACIDFKDFAPGLIEAEQAGQGAVCFKYLVDEPLFRVSVTDIRRGERVHLRSHGAQVLGIISGRMKLEGGGIEVALGPGNFVLVPAVLERVTIEALSRCSILQTQF